MDAALPISIYPVSDRLSAYPQSEGPKSGLFEHLLDHFVPHARNNYHPHLFSTRLTALLSMLLVTFKIFTIAALTLGPVLPAFSSAITVDNIISLTNQSRQGYSLPALKENSELDQAAQTKANDMLAKGYFSHDTPDGKTPWDFITAAGYNYITAGENLAVNFSEAENVEDAWMNSPGHKANIVNTNYQDIGIGISQGEYQGHVAIFVVQMFGTLADQKISLSDAPTPVQQQTVPLPAKAVAKAPVAPTSKAQTPVVLVSQPASPTPASAAPLQLGQPQVQVSGSTVFVSAQASPSAVKVLATYGTEGIMLEPKDNNIWEGSLNISQLAAGNKTVVVKAYDLLGNSQTAQVADFAGSTPSNYGDSAQVESAHITLGSFSFDPKNAEDRFYLLFIAGMLTSLIVAIAVKRHIQHISLVANGAFVVVLACLLFMAH